MGVPTGSLLGEKSIEEALKQLPETLIHFYNDTRDGTVCKSSPSSSG